MSGSGVRFSQADRSQGGTHARRFVVTIDGREVKDVFQANVSFEIPLSTSSKAALTDLSFQSHPQLASTTVLAFAPQRGGSLARRFVVTIDGRESKDVSQANVSFEIPLSTSSKPALTEVNIVNLNSAIFAPARNSQVIPFSSGGCPVCLLFGAC